MEDWAAPQPDSLVITVLDGLKAEFPGVTIDTMCFGGMISNIDAKGIAAARHKASAADVCIVVAGENSQRYSAFGRTCGENCDRDDIDLPGMQEELLEAVASSGKPTILVLMTGRANSIAWAKENVDAILNVWEPGQMGGQAVAEVISGKVNPSGKLPVTMPRSVGQVPINSPPTTPVPSGPSASDCLTVIFHTPPLPSIPDSRPGPAASILAPLRLSTA